MTDTADNAPESPQMPKKRSSGESDADILATARKRLDIAISAYSETRNNERDDVKFAAGSSDNNWQWPNSAIATRTLPGDSIAARPMLTVNMLPQHIKQVTNDVRQNMPAGKIVPANGDASVDVAEVLEGIVRHIEYISDSDVVYGTANDNQVTFGEGYWRILTNYVGPDSFDQEIYLEPIEDSFSVYMDPTIKKPSGEGAQWCFILSTLTEDEYKRTYPDATPLSSLESSGMEADSGSQFSWYGDGSVRIAEYYYFDTKVKKLHLFEGGRTALEGTPEDEVFNREFGEPIKSRDVEIETVKYIKTNGYEVLERNDWPGEFIPVIRVLGNCVKVEGEIHFSGIVRNAKDPQRMYNYWTSQEAEMLALAPKAPFIGYGGQFEGYENKWNTANTQPWPYLEVNPDAADGEGRAFPLPQRAQPPMAQQGLIAAKQAAAEDIKRATGQYNASLGERSNERSGKAILARQHEGDVSTYHYSANLAWAVRYSTRQIVGLIPKIYDTARVARMIGEDGTSKMVKMDPAQPHPMVEVKDRNTGVTIEKIYNPGVGRYDVAVVTGPGYATKRREALDAMAQLLQGNPELWGVAGDLFVKNMDWPGARELADRFKKSIDPKLLADEDNPALQQAKQQLEQVMQELNQAHMMLQNVQKSMEAKDLDLKYLDLQIKMYSAETDRMKVTEPGMTEKQVQDIATATVHAAVHTGDVIGTISQHQMQEPPAQEQQESPQEPPQQEQMEVPQPMQGGADAAPTSQPMLPG